MKILVIALLVFFIADVNCQAAEQTQCITNFLTNNLDATTSIATDCPDLVINIITL